MHCAGAGGQRLGLAELNSIGQPILEELWRGGMLIQGFTTTNTSKGVFSFPGRPMVERVAIQEVLILASRVPHDRCLEQFG